MRIYALINQKGGVGKTTCCLNIGAALALKKQKVLLIDLDPSGNLTTGAGVKVEQETPTIYEVLKGNADINEAIQKAANGNYDILPADTMLSGANIEFSNVPGREMILKEALENINKKYDYILMDCPRALDTLSIMSLVAAQKAIVPVQAQYYALDGVAQLVETIKLVQKRMNPALEIGGVIVTMYDQRKVSNREVLEALQRTFQEKVFKTYIGNYTALSEAPSYGMDIFGYKPKDKGALQYKELTKEILKL